MDSVAPQAPLLLGELYEAIRLVIAEDKIAPGLSAVED